MPKPLRPERQTERGYLEFQRLAAGLIMHPLGRNGGMDRTAPDGRPAKKVAASFVKPNDRLTAFERLEIYNRQYWYRLKDCLYDDYPGLRAVLGETRFARVTEAYLTNHPSRSFTLRNLGQDLVPFLEAAPRRLAPFQGPALDMARLEWAHIEAFDNEAKPKLRLDSLLGADPAKIYLRLQPHLALLALQYELDSFLIKIRRNQQMQEEASNAVAEKRRPVKAPSVRAWRRKPNFLAVYRLDETVYYKRLEPGQFHILSAIQSGHSLTDACEALARSFKDDAEHVQAWFQSWASLGWFCALD